MEGCCGLAVVLKERKPAISKVEEYMLLEEEGRRRAADRDSLPVGDEDFLGRLEVAAEEIGVDLYQEGFEEESKFADNVLFLSFVAASRARDCLTRGLRRGVCPVAVKVGDKWFDPFTLDEYIAEVALLDALDENSKRFVNSRCTYLKGEISPYTWSAFLNDLTSCYHTLLDFYRDVKVQWRKEGKCLWRELV